MAKFTVPEYSFIGPYGTVDALARVSFLSHRYWVFACTRYYPSGGLGDFRGSADTAEEANEMVEVLRKELTLCEWTIYDSLTGKSVEGEDD